MIKVYLIGLTAVNPIIVWLPSYRSLLDYQEFKMKYIKKYGYSKFCEIVTECICINGKAIQIELKGKVFNKKVCM